MIFGYYLEVFTWIKDGSLLHFELRTPLHGLSPLKIKYFLLVLFHRVSVFQIVQNNTFIINLG